MQRIDELEEQFQKLSSETTLSEPEFNSARFTIDQELNKIYLAFPDLEAWNENR
jgi:hypothetical protein